MTEPRPTARTARLDVRPPVERDRSRFVELFGDDAFMAFSGGPLTAADAHARFDRMLALSAALPFAKQPVVERRSGTIVGYTGVDRMEVEGTEWLEWGYRLVPGARGRGYATEAGLALLAVAGAVFHGEILAIIHPDNRPSQRVIGKLGFAYWKQGRVEGELCNLYRRRL